MNENKEFSFLDGLTIVSFLTQIKNIENDEQYVRFIKHVIMFLVQEISKLHQENDEIISKLNLLLEQTKGE